MEHMCKSKQIWANIWVLAYSFTLSDQALVTKIKQSDLNPTIRDYPEPRYKSQIRYKQIKLTNIPMKILKLNPRISRQYQNQTRLSELTLTTAETSRRGVLGYQEGNTEVEARALPRLVTPKLMFSRPCGDRN